MDYKDHRTIHFRDFCLFLSEVRSYFLGRGFLETPTPTLVPCPGMEAHLDPFEVRWEEKTYFLPTSPEIHLKKRLCQGFERIFELRPCFRKDPSTPLHRPEFFMLEWYRAHEKPEALQEDIRGLLMHLESKGLWKYGAEVKKTSFRELFKHHLDFDLKPDTSAEELKTLFGRNGLHFHVSDTKVDLIHRLLLEKFEPSFKGLVILEEFPPEMAILSRLNEAGFAQRFELYFNQVELANAFYEVTDPELQRERWEGDQRERRELGRPVLEYDEELIRLMKNPGLPESSGIAMGLDRLFMVGRDLKEISEIGF